jgi:hypothetical protein
VDLGLILRRQKKSCWSCGLKEIDVLVSEGPL